MALPGSLEYVLSMRSQVYIFFLTRRQLLQGGLGVTGFVSNYLGSFLVIYANHENRMALHT